MRPIALTVSVMIAAAAVLSVHPTEASKAESVYIIHADSLDRHAIVERSNGEQYLIEVGVGCLSLQFADGETAVIVSPGLFAGIGSRLVLLERDQDCRILRSEKLDPALDFASTSRSAGVPSEDSRVQQLESLLSRSSAGSPANTRRPLRPTRPAQETPYEVDGNELVVGMALIVAFVGWWLGRRK